MKSIASHPIPTQLPLMLVQFPEDSQWVRLGSGVKTPLPGVPWRSARPTYPDLQDHVVGGGNGGVVPASADWREGIRLAMLDIDRGDAAALTAAYRPVALAQTRRGAHAWYLSDDPPAVNATWSGPGGTGGDYRGMNGYAALHGDELAVVDAGALAHRPRVRARRPADPTTRHRGPSKERTGIAAGAGSRGRGVRAVRGRAIEGDRARAQGRRGRLPAPGDGSGDGTMGRAPHVERPHRR